MSLCPLLASGIDIILQFVDTLCANRKNCKHMIVNVAFTREYSWVSISMGNVNVLLRIKLDYDKKVLWIDQVERNGDATPSWKR
jgi:hypothetical protein